MLSLRGLDPWSGNEDLTSHEAQPNKKTKNKKSSFFFPPKQGNIFTSTRDQGVDIFGGKGAIIKPITVAQEFGTEQVKK